MAKLGPGAVCCGKPDDCDVDCGPEDGPEIVFTPDEEATQTEVVQDAEEME